MDSERREWLHRTARSCGYMIRRGYARELRKNLTPSEKALWVALRKYKTGGRSWRRQHIIDRFIVDFVHLGSKVAVEVDGGYHYKPDQQILDKERDEALENLGWKMVRYMNEEVLNNPDKIASSLQEIVSKIGLSMDSSVEVLPSGESVGLTEESIETRQTTYFPDPLASSPTDSPKGRTKEASVSIKSISSNL